MDEHLKVGFVLVIFHRIKESYQGICTRRNTLPLGKSLPCRSITHNNTKKRETLGTLAHGHY